MFKKVNRMFQRLHNLTKYFQSCEITDSRIVIIENTLNDLEGTVHFKFYTKLGPVEIVLNGFTIDAGIIHTLSYTTYAGVRLFKVRADEHGIGVEPCMGYSYNVDAKDIDLAILELENYLEDNYGKLEDKWEQYELEKKLAWESHHEQIKELY